MIDRDLVEGAAKAMGEWVPVAERWPEEKTSVLVATKHGMAVCMWEWVAGRRWWTPTAVVAEYGYECSLFSHWGVESDAAATHWMPLPSPPRVVSDAPTARRACGIDPRYAE